MKRRVYMVPRANPSRRRKRVRKVAARHKASRSRFSFEKYYRHDSGTTDWHAAGKEMRRRGYGKMNPSRRRGHSVKARVPAMDMEIVPRRGRQGGIKKLLRAHGFRKSGKKWKLHTPPMDVSVRAGRANPGLVRRSGKRPSRARYPHASKSLMAKRERCIRDIKRRKGKKPYSPWAVCTKSVERGRHYDFSKRRNPARGLRYEVWVRRGSKIVPVHASDSKSDANDRADFFMRRGTEAIVMDASTGRVVGPYVAGVGRPAARFNPSRKRRRGKAKNKSKYSAKRKRVSSKRVYGGSSSEIIRKKFPWVGAI